MIELQFQLNGKEAGTPSNAKEIKLKANWSGSDTLEDNSDLEITTNTLNFVLEDVEAITKHINDGKIFEGIPYAIKLRNLHTGIVTDILDGYIDLAEKNKLISCDEIESIIKKRKALDWLTSKADSFSFAYLRQIGQIKDSDYVPIPYVLNYRPEAFQLVMLSMSIYMSTDALISSIKDVSKSTTKFIEAINAGLAFGVGDLISAGLNLVFDLAYALALSYALIKMTEELIDQLFPPVRRYRGMRVSRMFEIGCNFMGLTFDSSIFESQKWSNMVYLPSKDKKGGLFGSSNGVGHPNANSAIYNFGDFLRVFKDFFNAKMKVVGNTLQFERSDYWKKLATWTLPDVETDQDSRLSSFSYNTNEINSNLLISFQTDLQDENTLENFRGTNYQVITSATGVNNPDFVNIKGLAQVKLPFALATRKNELTTVEEILKELAQTVDRAVNALGGSSSLSNKISKRQGMMNLSSDVISTDKLIILNGEQIPQNRADQLQASDLWQFHQTESFVPINGVHNQSKVFESVTIPFCEHDWNLLIGNNEFIAPDGSIGEISEIEWDIYNEKANINYKIPYLYARNLSLNFNEGE